MTRRQLLRRFFGLWQGLAGLLALGAALPALAFWWRSSKGDDAGGEETWIDLGSAPKVPEGEWLSKTFVYERRDRWRLEQARELIYLRRDGRTFTVLSAVCPHTGCLVRREGEGFACPCHKSFFDGDGRPVDGPSPRSLDPLEWKVEKLRLLVRYQRFRPGLAEPVVLDG